MKAKRAKKSTAQEDQPQFIIRFHNTLRSAGTNYNRFCSANFVAAHEFKDPLDVYVRWLAYDAERYEKEVLAGTSKPYIHLNELWKVKEAATFWKCFDPYEGLHLPWRIHFSEKARRRFINFAMDERYLITEKVLILAQGHFSVGRNCNIVKEGPCRGMIAFYTTIKESLLMLWCTQVHRVPTMHRDRLNQYDFQQHMCIIEFAKKESVLHDSLKQYHNGIQNDPDKWLLPGSQLDDGDWGSCPTFATSVCMQGSLAVPVLFPPHFPSREQLHKIEFQNGRWRLDEEKSEKQIKQTVETYLTQINAGTLEQLADAESCKGFIRLLETIPNFRIRLTDQERDLIGTPGNVLAIGRSGTGKTTCALLRLFASEVLFKYRMQKMKGKGARLVNTRFEADDVDSSCGLHIVFATASPVLTNEVKRFYWRLNDHIKEELKRRNELRKLRQAEANEDYDVIEDAEGELDLRRQASEEKDEIKLRTDAEAAADGELDEEEEVITKDGTHSLALLTDDDFPLFTTIRRLVLMVDATQRRPFFARNVDGAIIGMNAGSEWHNEMKGVLMINREYKQLNDPSVDPVSSDSSEEESEEESEPVSKATPKTSKTFSFEVDYEYFAKHFFPRISQRAGCSAITLWTEIVAYIKGSADSYKHPGWYLPKHVYVLLGKKTSFIKVEDKYHIWDMFIEYEKWRLSLGAYDFQDVVNYQLYSISLYGYQGVPLHYMMIDEVQDLTHATLLLLAKVTEQSLFFSGDTAQTIAKGVGFRFCDLRSLFYQDSGLKLAKPEIRQLTINFRSHGKILALANSVVSLLEALFPRTIDKLAKEQSSIDGPKPMILNSQSVDELFMLLFGAQNLQAQEVNLLSRAPIEFGCDQVIIVRSQAEKEQLPAVLKGALCLTVYESKGLEFDDVVLYNFFADTEVSDVQWRILQQLTITGDAGSTVPTDFDTMETAPVSVTLDNPNFDDSKYSMLCTELKMLYVAITRPRKRLIIFDTLTASRDFLLEYWRKLAVVDELHVVAGSDGIDIVNTTNMTEVVESIASATTAGAWRSQGIRMMKHRFYDQAVKCFEYSKDENLMRRARCYSLANEAAEGTGRAQQTVEMMKMNKEKLKPSDRRALRDAKELAVAKFLQAGQDFESLGMLKQAAKCYFSARHNRKAADLFAACESWGQCAEAYLASGDFRAAGEMFEKAGEYLRAIESYKVVREWDLVLDCIHRFSESMTAKEKESLIKKYIPLALEELMPKVVPVDESDQMHMKKLEEEKGIVEEEDEDSDSEPNEQNAGIATEEKTEDPSVDEKPASDHLEDIQSAQSLDSSSVLSLSSSIDQSLIQISAAPIAQSTNPFDPTNPFAATALASAEVAESDSASSYSVISSEIVPDSASRLEILSHYDPDDEWLQVESGSVADSLQSAVQKDGSVSFDYSIFDNSQAVALNLGGQLIKTRADVFVEDGVMRKILQYISMFSEDVRKYLEGLRSAEQLAIKEEVKVDWRMASMIDLDEVDIQLITTVLDTLEYFQLYKLCLVVCNRYSLSDRLGRYMTSLAHKYSTLPDALSLTQDKPLLLQKEKAAISFTAVHNVLEMIHPAVLLPKSPHDDKSLGVSCFQGLLLMGYWKKCVYLLDQQNALAITATFGDYKNYKFVLVGNTGEGTMDCFRWVPRDCTPETATIAIDEATQLLNQTFPVTLCINRKEPATTFPTFPDYAEFNESFWRFVQQRSTDTTAAFKRHIAVATLMIAETVNQTTFLSAEIAVRIHDCFSFLTQTLYASKSLPPVKELLESLSCEHFDLLLAAVNAAECLLSLRKNAPGFSAYHMPMIYALLAPLGVREIRESEVTCCLPLGTHVMVSRCCPVTFQPKTKAVPIDMEGDFFMCPLNLIANSVALELIKLSSELAKSRYSHWLSHRATCDFQFDTIETLSTLEHSVKTAACVFGESAYICEMQSRYPAVFPNALLGVKPDMAASTHESELEILEKELSDILAIGDGDRKSMLFVRTKHALHISTLERRIAELRKAPSTVSVSSFAELYEAVTAGMVWIMSDPPVITRTARNYLLTYTQSYIRTIRYSSDSDRTQKMVSAYRVFALCRAESLLLDFIRVKTRPVLQKVKFGKVETAEKVAMLSNKFLDDLAWLDVQVYSKNGDWAEAGNTLIRYLDCQFPYLTSPLRMEILEKATLFGLAAHCDRVYLPEFYEQKMRTLVDETESHQTDCSPLLESVLTWLNTLSGDISQAYSMRNDSSLHLQFARSAFTLITCILISLDSPHAKVLMAFDTLRGSLNRHIHSGADPFLKRLLSVTKTKDITGLRNDVNRLKSQMLMLNFVQMSITRRTTRGEVDRSLDSALVTETQGKSLIATLDYRLYGLGIQRKKKYDRLKLKSPTQVVDFAERISLTRVSALLPAHTASAALLQTWRNARAAMRLYKSISQLQLVLLEYNQRSSLFTNVLDRHYVLHQLATVAGVYCEFQKLIYESAASGNVAPVLTFANTANSEMELKLQSFAGWKTVVSANKKLDVTSKKKKKWDARWKMRLEHKQEDTGRKKQWYLQRRAILLKRAHRS